MSEDLHIRLDGSLKARIILFMNSNNYKTTSDACRALLLRGLDTPIVKEDISAVTKEIAASVSDALEANAKEIAILRKGSNKGTRASMATLALLSLYLSENDDDRAGGNDIVGDYIRSLFALQPDFLFDFTMRLGGLLQAGNSLPGALSIAKGDLDASGNNKEVDLVEQR